MTKSELVQAIKNDEAVLVKYLRDFDTLLEGGVVENLTLAGCKKTIEGLEQAIANKEQLLSKGEKFYVYFNWDGIPGRETFEVSGTGLDAYSDAFAQFHQYARDVGAVRIEGPRSAWDQVLIYHGPKTLYAVPARSN